MVRFDALLIEVLEVSLSQGILFAGPVKAPVGGIDTTIGDDDIGGSPFIVPCFNVLRVPVSHWSFGPPSVGDFVESGFPSLVILPMDDEAALDNFGLNMVP